jgi:dTDP-4-dehydrorhamnose reductase
MRVVITGFTGILGRYLALGAPKAAHLYGVSRNGGSVDGHVCHPIDLVDHQEMARFLDVVSPELIINAAAEGSVDAVENNMEAFRPLNVDAAAMLAAYSAQHGIGFIQISSNAVYGESRIPLTEESPHLPVNDYGRLKAEAEQAVTRANPGALIVRPILMYGWPLPSQRVNPVVHWLREAALGRSVRVVADVHTQPLAALDCAAAVWKAVESQISGSLNVGGASTISLCDFARATMQEFELPQDLVIAASSEDFPEIAARPRKVEFQLDRLRSIGISPMNPIEGLLWLHRTM